MITDKQRKLLRERLMGKNFTLLSESIESDLIERENSKKPDSIYSWGSGLNSKKLDESSPFKYKWETGYKEQNKQLGINEQIKRKSTDKKTFQEQYGII
jgi:hypothetical protein